MSMPRAQPGVQREPRAQPDVQPEPPVPDARWMPPVQPTAPALMLPVAGTPEAARQPAVLAGSVPVVARAWPRQAVGQPVAVGQPALPRAAAVAAEQPRRAAPAEPVARAVVPRRAWRQAAPVSRRQAPAQVHALRVPWAVRSASS